MSPKKKPEFALNQIKVNISFALQTKILQQLFLEISLLENNMFESFRSEILEMYTNKNPEHT